MNTAQLQSGTTRSRAGRPAKGAVNRPKTGPADRRFGIVLLLLVVTYLFMACGFTGAWARFDARDAGSGVARGTLRVGHPPPPPTSREIRRARVHRCVDHRDPARR